MADRPTKNPNKKGTTHLQRARVKAHYNFHKRMRDAEEERKLKQQLDSDSLDFDVNESPLAHRANPNREPKPEKTQGQQRQQQRQVQQQGSTPNGTQKGNQ